MSRHKEVRKLLELAESVGFRFVRYTGSGHYKLETETGQSLVIPSTPGGPRWRSNVLAEIKRAKTRRRK